MRINLNKCKECGGSAKVHISNYSVDVTCINCRRVLGITYTEDEKKKILNGANLFEIDSFNRAINNWNDQNERD